MTAPAFPHQSRASRPEPRHFSQVPVTWSPIAGALVIRETGPKSFAVRFGGALVAAAIGVPALLCLVAFVVVVGAVNG